MEGKAKETSRPPCLCKYVDPLSEESHRYYLARHNALEMLRDRGYEVSDEDIKLSLQDFRALYGERPDVDRLSISAQHRSDCTRKVVVVFFGTGMVKVNAIRCVAADVLTQGTITGLILVLQSHVTNQALKAIELFSFKVEIFQITDLLVNITKHILKPQNQVLNEEQKTTLLKKFSINDKQLPRISKKDAIVRYYGLEKGQVLKVNYRVPLMSSVQRAVSIRYQNIKTMEAPPFIEKFEDDQSSLMDRFERLSFEAHLSNALLGRSLSESGFSLMYSAMLDDDSPKSVAAPVSKGRRGLGLNKILKKLMKPIKCCSRRICRGRKQETHDFDPKNFKKWHTFSKSVRLF